MNNSKVGGDIEQLKHMMSTLQREEEELRELGEDAGQAARSARRQLLATQVAVIDQQVCTSPLPVPRLSVPHTHTARTALFFFRRALGPF